MRTQHHALMPRTRSIAALTLLFTPAEPDLCAAVAASAPRLPPGQLPPAIIRTTRDWRIDVLRVEFHPMPAPDRCWNIYHHPIASGTVIGVPPPATRMAPEPSPSHYRLRRLPFQIRSPPHPSTTPCKGKTRTGCDKRGRGRTAHLRGRMGSGRRGTRKPTIGRITVLIAESFSSAGSQLQLVAVHPAPDRA